MFTSSATKSSDAEILFNFYKYCVVTILHKNDVKNAHRLIDPYTIG